MLVDLRRTLTAAFAPPHYLVSEAVGVDLSASGIKVATLSETAHGLVLSSYADARLPAGAFADGDFVDRGAVVNLLGTLRKQHHLKNVHASLPEAKSYVFETAAAGHTKDEWRTAVEPHLDELIPLPPAEAAFDVVPVGQTTDGEVRITGVGYARRVVESTLSVFDEAGISVQSLEGEMFAAARALLPHGDTSTTLIIDVGRTTTKLAIVASRIPLFATTIGIGGHSLTLAVQKHFGVTEDEARRIKAERGIVSSSGNEDYIAAMFSTVSAIKDEIAMRLQYWQGKAAFAGAHEPVSRAILVGGNASLRGFPEYLEGILKIPVAAGDVFTNLASRNVWLPPLEYAESLAYATSIGLALRNYVL
ncbi:MAG TPA: pilus assembly protein PilM [Candidatus Paceibacterota bacterium]|nr:pilus assembly protein PilM [Candidatus Paceibacterota bacterium]